MKSPITETNWPVLGAMNFL